MPDTNVLINMLAGREPPEVTALHNALAAAHLSAPTLSELRWTSGHLDDAHPRTAQALARMTGMVARFAPARVLVPTAEQWSISGETAGRTTRAGGGKTRSSTATDRLELISEALTAILAQAATATMITADADFDPLMQFEPALKVLFYG